MPKVMVVDDSTLVTRMVSVFLARLGYAVEVVNTSSDVYNRIRETAPDLLVLDLGLPGISGQGLITIIRNNAEMAHLPIVLISADEAKMKEVVAAGDADDYFVKGNQLAALETKIRKLLLEPPAVAGRP